MRYSHISVAIPLLAEFDNLPILIESLRKQSINGFSVYLCVNNREGWADSSNETERAMFIDNQKSLAYLKKQELHNSTLTVIDCSSPGNGWHGKQHGVGWARKTLFDTIATKCDDDELIVSLDADT